MRFSLLRTAAVLVTVAQVVDAAFAELGKTVSVDGIFYYAAPNPISTILLTAQQLVLAPKCTGDDSLIPFTVMEDKSPLFNATVFDSIVKNYTAVDDVFNKEFLQTIYLKHTGSFPAKAQFPLDASFATAGTKLFLMSQSYATSGQVVGWKSEIPAGPYFMSPSSGEVFAAYRLYSDVQGAFTEGLIAPAESGGNFSVLPASVPGAQSPTIGVPSRLYYSKTASKPLAGVRLGIKDIYDIAGTRTSCGNRAYYAHYPERNATASVVQRLIDAGAIIVGKMKTSQFANGETATADWVDYHSPFNARGDGYQDPSSSSSGPGAGMGAYEWLDLALGSDTGGSIRNPAQQNGVFGNRASHGLVTLDNVMPLSPALDTAGFLCRDAVLWKTAAKVMYASAVNFSYTSYPKKLYTYNFPTKATTEAEAVLLDFVAKLQKFLAVNATVLDYDKLWASTGPSNVSNLTLSQFVGPVYRTLISQQQYRLLAAPFYESYGKANGGRRPFIDPAPLVRWSFGQKNISLSTEAEALSNVTVFADWWKSKVLVPDAKTCSDSLMLYPGYMATTNYRNVYLSPPSPPGPTMSVSRVSPFTGVPDFAVPIGQAAYNSTITLQTEYLPVAVDILAAKGCDGVIYNLVEQLQLAGIVRAPKTGSVMY